MSTSWTLAAPRLSENAIGALAVLNGEIYAGTGFNGKLYKWNGSNAWIEVAPKLGSETWILSLVVLNGEIYGGTAPNGKLYKWNGSNAWVQVAGTYYGAPETYIRSLTVFNGEIYAGTYPSANLLKWNGSNAWVSVAPKYYTYVDSIWALAVKDGKIYGSTDGTYRLYEWSGSNAWVQKAINPSSLSNARALAVFNGKLYAGGSKQVICEWNGVDAWVPKTPQESEGDIGSLCVLNNELYAGIIGTSTGNSALKMWNGTDALEVVCDSDPSTWSINKLTSIGSTIFGGTSSGTLFLHDPFSVYASSLDSTGDLSATIAVGAVVVDLSADAFSGQLNLSAAIAEPTKAGLRSTSETSPYTSEILVAEPVITDGIILGYHTWSDFGNGDGSTQSYGIDQEVPTSVEAIRIHLSTEYNLTIPTSWEGARVFSVYASTDNSSWTHVEDFPNPEIFNDDYNQFHISLVLSTPVKARYIKVVSAGAVRAGQNIGGTWAYDAVEVAEFETAGYLLPENAVVFSDAINGTFSFGGIALSNPIYANHGQVVTTNGVYVTLPALYGTFATMDPEDALVFETGAELSFLDERDDLSFEAALGGFAVLSIRDEPDVFTTLPGGAISFQDRAESIFLTGLAEARAVCAWRDSPDTLEIEALSGIIAELNAIDAADLMAMTGQPETTGCVALVDVVDAISLQAMGGIIAGMSLSDALDLLSMTAAPEESGALCLLDLPDILQVAANNPSRFATHIIQYQKSRY